ncbi:hypothetical protein PDL71_09275 [Lacibacter sp. MH-610]|uniref:tetratricopeptide repeat protein n=1 Tax=Lacibacter sp. MH-610 TaxID=3020883 RepID=UPI0038924AD4
MKQYFFLLLMLSFHLSVQSQSKKPVNPAMPDVNAMMKMSPAELEAYKQKILKQSSMQAKQIAAQSNIKLDEMLLPDFEVKMPPKDMKRLALIPKQPPTLIQLADGLLQSKKQLESVTPKVIVEEVKNITAVQTPEQQHGSAIGAFYGDKPVEALLIAMNAVLKNPSEAIGWNNLAAMMNMTGLEHKAIPILMHHLQNEPDNSMLLNNMGQAYLGLGDIGMAELFLKQCLQSDPYHPEANRSMGMIRFFYKEYEEGMKYFEKELETAMRRSTLALMRSKNSALNLYRLRKRRPNMPQRNFFDEIQLGKFTHAPLPERTDETRTALAKMESFGQSVTNEMLYWNEKSLLSKEEIRIDGQRIPGIYADLVEALLHDLHEVYTPQELSLFTDLDLNHIAELLNDYHRKLAAVECPVAPAGATHEVYEAYIKKCCDLKKPIMDAFVQQYNAFVTARAKRGIGIWREYINDLINIVSLEPSAGNKIMVYKALHGYFIFLSGTGMGQFLDPPMECSVQLNTNEADSIIASSRNVDLKCPQALNIEFDVVIAKLKADCNKYAIEGGKLLQGMYEHNFRTGTTTLAAGVGLKAKFFKETGSADIKQMVYISFDNNNEFSDFGLMGKASVKIADNPISVGEKGKIGGTIGGIEGGYTLGMNSGWKSYVKGTGALADFIKIQ